MVPSTGSIRMPYYREVLTILLKIISDKVRKTDWTQQLWKASISKIRRGTGKEAHGFLNLNRLFDNDRDFYSSGSYLQISSLSCLDIFGFYIYLNTEVFTEGRIFHQSKIELGDLW